MMPEKRGARIVAALDKSRDRGAIVGHGSGAGREPMVLLLPLMSRMPGESTVKAELGLKAVVEPAWSVPLFTVVAPL